MTSDLTDTMLTAIEEELRQAVALAQGAGLDTFHHMLAYHLGWEGEGAGPEARGKRIRPLVALLTASAAGGNWERALPAAAAVELVHNFSLIHDDIEDHSPLRRGRPTVWAKWGVPQAINTGDAMFALAHLAMLRLNEMTSAATTVQAMRIIQQTCLHLTQGQHLDIGYEKRTDLTLEDYWPMVSGKTAALLAACTELGALVADATADRQMRYRQFGRLLGLAFQAQDDLLGIWGDALVTGKSAESDLVEGKKSLPVLYGLSQRGPFAARWAQGQITPAEVPAQAAQLEAEGAREYTWQTADRLTNEALQALEAAYPQGEAGQSLQALTRKLLGRAS
jgi:geranylgeranyl diphosphate synthase type I